MRHITQSNAAIAAVLASLGAAAGIGDPIDQIRQAIPDAMKMQMRSFDDQVHATRRFKNSMRQQKPIKKKNREKNKAARKARSKNR